jgi:hypothetical protein
VFVCPVEENGEPETVKSFVLRASETSRRFESLIPYPPLDMKRSIAMESTRKMYEMTDHDGPVRPWLCIHIYYETPFGTGHFTNFCAMGRSDGEIFEYEEAPYSERT